MIPFELLERSKGMNNRVEELTEAIRALAEVQRNETTIVNNELHRLIRELMDELNLKN